MIKSASEKLKSAFEQGKHICVGLDTDIKKLPANILKSTNPILDFNKEIIDATKENAAAYKLNLAFYEKEGSKGFDLLLKTIELIPDNVLIIGDAKRGDIGNTSMMYANSLYNHFRFDSVTLNPYMGFDSIEPFLLYEDKLNFILALTSNQGAKDFEKLKLQNGKYLYQAVIKKVKSWNTKNNCGIVFGANKNDELNLNIDLFGNLFILLPGVGAQGGSLEDVVRIFNSKNNFNFLVNVSRAIIYADSSNNFAEIASLKLSEYNKTISKLLQT